VIAASISRRYARALFSLALEEGGHERTGEELEAVAQALRASTEARTVVENPGYTQAQRHALVDILVQKLSLSPLLAISCGSWWIATALPRSPPSRAATPRWWTRRWGACARP